MIALYRVKNWIEEQGLLPDSGLVIAGVVRRGGFHGYGPYAPSDLAIRAAGLCPCEPRYPWRRRGQGPGVCGRVVPVSGTFPAGYYRQMCRESPKIRRRAGSLRQTGAVCVFPKPCGGRKRPYCTAHTRSDQAETVLLHLIQGAGAKGNTRSSVFRQSAGILFARCCV